MAKKLQRYRFVIEVTGPADCKRLVRYHIGEAVDSWGGQFDPSDERYEIGFTRVKDFGRVLTQELLKRKKRK